MAKAHTFIDSPLGEILLIVEDGIVTGLYQPDQPNRPDSDTIGVLDRSLRFHPVCSELRRYFNGSKAAFGENIAPPGTEFQKRVWDAVVNIPYGKFMTYAQLAVQLGSPKAVRAIASAVASNPVTVIIPCHRVVSKNGDVKYSGGAENKKHLLALEAGNL